MENNKKFEEWPKGELLTFLNRNLENLNRFDNFYKKYCIGINGLLFKIENIENMEKRLDGWLSTCANLSKQYTKGLTQLEKEKHSLEDYISNLRAKSSDVHSDLEQTKKQREEQYFNYFEELKKRWEEEYFDSLKELKKQREEEYFDYFEESKKRWEEQYFNYFEESKKRWEVQFSNHFEECKGIWDKGFLEDFRIVKGQAEQRYSNFEKGVAESEKRIEEYEGRIKELLGGALSGVLASSFKDAKKETLPGIEKGFLLGGFFLSLLALAGGYISLFFTVDMSEITISLILMRLSVGIPLIWMAWFFQKSISERERIKEEFHHKETMMRLYDGFEKHLGKLPAGENEETKALIKVMIDAISVNPAETLGKGSNSMFYKLTKTITKTMTEKMTEIMPQVIPGVFPQKTSAEAKKSTPKKNTPEGEASS